MLIDFRREIETSKPAILEKQKWIDFIGNNFNKLIWLDSILRKKNFELQFEKSSGILYFFLNLNFVFIWHWSLFFWFVLWFYIHVFLMLNNTYRKHPLHTHTHTLNIKLNFKYFVVFCSNTQNLKWNEIFILKINLD